MKSKTNKNILELINSAKKNGIELWVEDQALKFRAQNGVFPVDLKSLLTSHKLQIIDYLSNNPGLDKSTLDDKTYYEAAFAQERLWFIAKLSEESAHYNISLAYIIQGNLNITIFQQALLYLVHRHAALRTRFCEVEGKVKQIVSNNLETEKFFNYTDLTGTTDPESGLNKLSHDLNNIRFNLETSPLFKANLIKVAELKYLFSLCFHHIIADEYSVELFLQELSVVYEATLSQKAITLLHPTLSYVDYAAWQRQELKRSSEKFKQYWQQAINTQEQRLDFPYDYKHKPYASYQGGHLRHHHVLSQDFQQKLAQLQSGSTVFTVLLTAYFVFLYRYTGQKLLTVGIPFTNRTRPTLKDVFGMFVNSLPIQIQLDGTATFLEVLAQVKQKVLEAYRHGEFPFEKIVDALSLQRHAAHNPLFQTMFFNTSAGNNFKLHDYFVARIKLDTQTSKFDFSVIYALSETEIVFDIEYNRDLLKESTVQRFTNHLANIFSAAILTPEKSIGILPILSEDEHRWAVLDINNNQQPFRENVSVIQLFEETVNQHPDATAVEYLQQRISYQELNEKANQLAHCLREKRIGPEKCVVVFMERSIDVVIALLAIMKTGGVFIPLDIEYPQARIQHILEDSQAKIVLTHKHHIEKLDFVIQEKLLIDRNNFHVFSKHSCANLSHITAMEDLVYIIYTSGSTGKPKGVMIKQSGLAHYILWAVKYYECHKGSGSPAHSSLGFDLTITTIFTPLCCGKTVFMTPEELGVEGLLNALKERQDYSLIKITPAHLKLFQELLPKETLQKLFATVVIGGEALYADDLAFWRAHSPKMRFINEYGATETSVACTVYEVSSVLPETVSLPVGKAIANSSMFVLDEYLQPQPIGVIGEIYLGGNQIARGYLNKTELNAKKFLSNPFPELVGDKIYKTGDFGRLLADGNVVFVGRIDDQVKVNGYRIELGEIEVCLEELNTVKHAVCQVRTSDAQGKYIAAYIVPNLNEKLTRDTIKAYLKTKLPDYMIPRFLVFLAALPLTINGKVDVKALPDPEESENHLANNLAIPHSKNEIILHTIWCELFKRKTISVKDNFFRLGGDSITSLQMVFQAKKQGLIIKPKQVFNHQTIKELAAVAQLEATVLYHACPKGKLPLTPIQAWFFSLDLAELNHWNQAFILQCNRSLHRKELTDALIKLTISHAALRTRFVQTEQGWKQECLSEPPTIALVDAINVKTISATLLQQAIQRCHQSLDIKRGKLLHALLLKGEQQDKVLLVIHHLVTDGVSWRIITEDLSSLLNEKHQSVLPTSSSAFGYWAVKLEQYAKNISAQTIAYWQTIVSRVHQDLNLPLLSTPYREETVASITNKLCKEKTASLLAIAEKNNVKLQELLLATLALQLKPFTNSESILIDLEGHGREDLFTDIELTRTVGWFTSTYPFELPVNFTHSSELLFAIRHALKNLPDNGLSYGALRYLHSDTTIRESIGVNSAICFNHLGNFLPAKSTDALALTFEYAGRSVASSNIRPYAININTYIFNEELYVNLMANAKEEACHFFIATFFDKLYQLAQQVSDQIGIAKAMDLAAMVSYTDARIILDRYGAVITKAYPLTPLQQGMLYHSLYAPEKKEYICQMCWKIQGNIDQEKIKHAWQQVMEKYEVLRTVFIWEETAELYQVVLANCPLPLTTHQVTKPIEVEVLLNQDFNKEFNLGTAPVYRMMLIQQGDQTFMVWTFHHIILDGWSVGHVMFDFQLAYNGCPISSSYFAFDDYVRWVKSQSHENNLTYWKDYLRNRPLAPFFSRTAANNGHSYLEMTQRLNQKLTNQLVSFAAHHEITLNSLFITAISAVLAVLHQRSEIVMGLTISGRNVPMQGIEDAVGNFLNTIPIRVKVDKQSTIADLAKKVQSDLTAHQEYEFISLADIQRELRTNNTEDLLEILYVFENYPRKVPSNTNFMLSDLKAREYANYALTFIVAATVSAIEIKVTYNKSQISEQQVQGYFNQLIQLLNTVNNQEKVSLNRLPTLAYNILGHKVAHKKLSLPNNEVSGTVPREVRKRLLDSCAEILRVNLINRHLQQSFSELGGTSLSAIRMASKLRREFSVAISLKEFVGCQSLHELALLLQERIKNSTLFADEFEEVKI